MIFKRSYKVRKGLFYSVLLDTVTCYVSVIAMKLRVAYSAIMFKTAPETKSALLQVRLPPSLIKRARELSAMKGESVSTLTRMAIVRACNEELEAVIKRRADAAAIAAWRDDRNESQSA